MNIHPDLLKIITEGLLCPNCGIKMVTQGGPIVLTCKCGMCAGQSKVGDSDLVDVILAYLPTLSVSLYCDFSNMRCLLITREPPIDLLTDRFPASFKIDEVEKFTKILMTFQ